mgnify:FL=1
MGVVVSSGKGRATKYKLAKNARVSIPANQTTGQAELLPLSKQGKEIQRLVSPPRQKRHPVSYNRSFLDDYRLKLIIFSRPIGICGREFTNLKKSCAGNLTGCIAVL